MCMVAALAVILSLLLTPTLTEGQPAFADADLVTLNISRLDEILEDARRKFGSTDANDLFVNLPSIGDYFDNITTAAGFLELAVKARAKGFTNASMRYKYYDITGRIDLFYKDASRTTVDQAAPLGLRECWLIPEQLKNVTEFNPVGVTLNTLTGSGFPWWEKTYDYDTLKTACSTSNVDDSLQTLEALVGENCDKVVGRNGSMEEAMQEDMMQYAREHPFEIVDDENRCLHVFIARYTKSKEAMTKFKMSLDKYYLVSVTFQAFCAVFAPKPDKEAYRTKVLTTHSSFAKGLARLTTIQFDDNKPWRCDTGPDEPIFKMRAACEDLKNLTESTTYFLGNQFAEQYVNMTFEMVDVVRGVDTATFARLQEATTQKEVEVRMKTRLDVLGLLVDLLNSLQQFVRQFPKPFGLKDDILWPEDPELQAPGYAGTDWLIPNYKELMVSLEWLASSVAWMRSSLERGENATINGELQITCENAIIPAELLTRAVEPMKGVCENSVDHGPDTEYEWLATKLMTYAMSHGFDGCEDNKCLQIFIARYAEYAGDAASKLKNTVDKYALISVIVQSFCASTLEDPSVKEDVRRKSVEAVRSLKETMSVLNNLTSKADSYKQCAAGIPAWTLEVDAIASSVVDNATSSINASSWQAQQAVHELVANGIVTKLNDSTYKDGYYFTALAYLPFSDDGQHAFLSLPVGAEDMIRNESKLVKYVVARYRKKANQSLALVREKWDAIKEKGNQILDDTFSTSASNLLKRVEEIESRFEKDIAGPFLSSDGFRALVALRCGYEFVWYELGYRYFPAGFVTDGYLLATEQANKYKYNCGQLVFFP